ncbi:acyltransferase family protein [Aeromicrobium wangtongii]|uniref:Acyltransferase n=1 Tax=Aeromicrobium wangtongii TaxID=2969247 RepID=A0ABY5M1T4_9ACTN|nr:acyltransferase family protein [Aeromicrobium wangtongii]MCD9198134.1 acyltransferase [Aeromicrobium wangtongii]UUP12173.1 acyltransferase [Aeromicrobium wangtongii]
MTSRGATEGPATRRGRRRGDRSTASGRSGTFRPDIQGMRGLAVLLVVVHHAWPDVLPGGFVGVDMFFTVSGFVIGSLLLGEIGRTGAVDLYDFWTRRARRILPASLLVLGATLTATWLWAPATQRRAIGDDGLWATLFAANLRFIQQGTDYAAADRDPSPFQHFWSLAVEEQFYLAVPVIVAVCAGVAVRRGWATRRLLALVMVAVCVLSLAYSVHLTSASPTAAYFSPFTRAWQLAAGVAAACVVPFLARRCDELRDALGVAGLLGLGATIALLAETGIGGTGYPSYLSAAPTLSTVAVLLAGAGRPGLGAQVLSYAPLRHVGDISYSLYLWHWPVQIVAAWLVATGPLVNGLLMLLSYVLAVLSYRLVENPVRRSSSLASRRWVTAAAAICCIGVVSACASRVAAFDPRVAVRVASAPAAPTPPADRPGPGRTTEFDLRPSQLPSGSSRIRIDAATVLADYVDLAQKGCQRGYVGTSSLPDPATCTFGDGRRTFYLVGDSMATALTPAVGRAADRVGARLRVMAKASCTLATGVTVHKDEVGGAYRSCDRFRADLLDHLEQEKPDAVFMVNSNGSAAGQVDRDGRRTRASTWQRATTAGLVRTVQRLRAAGIPVVLIENPARPGDDDRATGCLLDGGTVKECTFTDTPAVGAYERAHRRLAGRVPLVRVNTHICPEHRCRPILGDVVVWRDDSHFTRTYARVLAPAFVRAARHVLR